ncbi:MAG: M23 family metallopeptidase [Bacteroidales bacterium]|nr:M23 family metallopeptidase [Bacteroidales bacterium]
MFIWPLPGYSTITTYFGETQNINGLIKAGHKGIDVTTRGASPAILAAAGGTVTVARLSSSYGNYVMIYHGNGYATLYAHMSSMAVSEGQVVTAGQVIGYVGSTGQSTGNHLHLEVRVNGTPTNPFNYFTAG